MTAQTSSETVTPLPELSHRSAALAVSTPSALAAPQTFDSFRLGLEPNSFGEASRFAAIVAKSGLYKVKTPEDALVRLMTGRALGLPATVSLQHVYEVYGMPSLSARLKMTLTLRHPECEVFEYVESDAKHAVYRIKRKGSPERKFEFKIEQAVVAGLVKKDSAWEKWPQRLCEARASSHASDVVFPDACMGLPTVEEALDLGPTELTKPDASPAQAATQRDFDAEALKLKEKITGAQTKEEKRAVHAEVASFCQEAGEPWASEAKTYYNLIHGPKKNGDAPAKDEPPFGSTGQGSLVK